MAATLTVKGLALVLGYSEYWIRELAREGKIPAIRRGRMWLFDEEKVRVAIYKGNSYTKKGIKKKSASQVQDL